MTKASAAFSTSPTGYYQLRIRELKEHTSWLKGLAGLLACATFIALGIAVAPGPLKPITASGNIVHWGGWAMETAFSFLVFQAAVVSFRVLERLFRNPLNQVVKHYPISGQRVLAERSLSAVCESLLWVIPLVGFLLGASWSSGGTGYSLVIVYCLVTAIFHGLVGTALTLVLAVSGDWVKSWFTPVSTQGGAERYAYFATIPAITLAALGLSDLLLKLGVEEFYRMKASVGAWDWTPAAIVIITVVIFLSLGVTLTAFFFAAGRYRRAFTDFHQAMRAPPAGEENWVVSGDFPRSRWTRKLESAFGLVVDRDYHLFTRLHPFLLLGNLFAIMLLTIAAGAWQNDDYLGYLAPAIAALWMGGAMRVVSRLRDIQKDSRCFDQGLISSVVRRRATQCASWLVCSRTLFPLLLGEALVILFTGAPSGILMGGGIATIVTFRHPLDGSVVRRGISIVLALIAASAALSADRYVIDAGHHLVTLGVTLTIILLWGVRGNKLLHTNGDNLT